MAALQFIKSAFVVLVLLGNAGTALGGDAGQKPNGQRFQLGVFPPSPLFDAVFSADGKLLALGCRDKEILVCDAATGEVRLTLQMKTDRVRSVALSPDGAL